MKKWIHLFYIIYLSDFISSDDFRALARPIFLAFEAALARPIGFSLITRLIFTAAIFSFHGANFRGWFAALMRLICTFTSFCAWWVRSVRHTKFASCFPLEWWIGYLKLLTGESRGNNEEKQWCTWPKESNLKLLWNSVRIYTPQSSLLKKFHEDLEQIFSLALSSQIFFPGLILALWGLEQVNFLK